MFPSPQGSSTNSRAMPRADGDHLWHPPLDGATRGLRDDHRVPVVFPLPLVVTPLLRLHRAGRWSGHRTSSSIGEPPSTSSLRGRDPGGGAPTVVVLAEAVSKSVAGAMFHTCPMSVELVDRASQVCQLLFIFIGRSIIIFVTPVISKTRISVKPSSFFNTRYISLIG